jgi:hypothetical protein
VLFLHHVNAVVVVVFVTVRRRIAPAISMLVAATAVIVALFPFLFVEYLGGGVGEGGG